MSYKYTKFDNLTGFGFLINAMGGGGDAGQAFPRSDAEDMSSGARFIPGEVTLARRRGERVSFTTNCTPCCWYWEFADKSRIYHFDPLTYDSIAKANGSARGKLAGPCPRCENPHTNGGKVK